MRSYIKQDGTEAFAMQLDVVGPWVKLAETALKVSPPPLKISQPEPAKGNGKKSASEAAYEASKAADSKAAKPPRKIAIAGKSEMDDEIPF